MKLNTTGICAWHGEQPHRERPRVGWSVVDSVAKRLDHSVGQAAHHVFVVEPEAGGGDDAEHPALLPM